MQSYQDEADAWGAKAGRPFKPGAGCSTGWVERAGNRTHWRRGRAAGGCHGIPPRLEQMIRATNAQARSARSVNIP